MKINIDVKSALFGLVAGVIAMAAIGATSAPGENGRYQVSGGEQGCAVMVDTRTGQAWAFQPSNTSQWKRDGNFWDVKTQ